MSQLTAMRQAMSHHVTRLPEDNGGQFLKTARSLIARVEAAADLLVQLTEKPDPMASELAMNIRRESARSELRKVTLEAKERADVLVKNLRDSVAAQREQTADLQPSPHASEIRHLFRELDTAAKLEFLNDAVARSDGATLGSLLTVPPFLAGLSPNLAANYKQMFLEKTVPLDTGYINSATDAMAGVISASNEMLA
jgi:hypothetical protein